MDYLIINFKPFFLSNFPFLSFQMFHVLWSVYTSNRRTFIPWMKSLYSPIFSLLWAHSPTNQFKLDNSISVTDIITNWKIISTLSSIYDNNDNNLFNYALSRCHLKSEEFSFHNSSIRFFIELILMKNFYLQWILIAIYISWVD